MIFSCSLFMKFLVDAMLGKLARFLRIFGYDTIYANDLISYYNIDPVPDEKLLEYALENERLIITKDFPFFSKIRGRGILLEGEGAWFYRQRKAWLRWGVQKYSLCCQIRLIGEGSSSTTILLQHKAGVPQARKAYETYPA